MIKQKSSADEKSGEIVSEERDPNNSESYYLHPKPKTNESEHKRVVEMLRQAVKHYLKKFSCDGDMWYRVYEFIRHKKDENMYSNIKEEVQIHLINDILSHFKSVGESKTLFKYLKKSELFESTVGVFSDLFEHLEISTDNNKKYGLKELCLKIIKEEVLFKREFTENLSSALVNATDVLYNNTTDFTDKQPTCEEISNYYGSVVLKTRQVEAIKGYDGACKKESLRPEFTRYKLPRNSEVLKSLRRAMRRHLKGSLSDLKLTDAADNMLFESYVYPIYGKCENLYVMFKAEVRNHLINNILSKLKLVEKTNMLSEFVQNWEDFVSKIEVFSDKFKHLDIWAENNKKESLKNLSWTMFREEIVLEKGFVKQISSALNNFSNTSNICTDAYITCEILKKLKCCEKVLKETTEPPNVDQQVSYNFTENLPTIIDEYRHYRVLQSLKKGISTCLKGNFSDEQLSEYDVYIFKVSFDGKPKQAKDIYNLVKDEVCNHLKNHVLFGLKSVEKSELLSVFAKKWRVFQSAIRDCRRLLMHLDIWINNFPESKKEDELLELSWKLFREEVVLEKSFVKKLQAAVINASDSKSSGKHCRKFVCKTLKRLGCYERVLKRKFFVEIVLIDQCM